jgi:hypothetical protein
VQETKDTAKAFHNFWSEHLKLPSNDLFSSGLEKLPLEKENLLDGFALSKAGCRIGNTIRKKLQTREIGRITNPHYLFSNLQIPRSAVRDLESRTQIKGICNPSPKRSIPENQALGKKHRRHTHSPTLIGFLQSCITLKGRLSADCKSAISVLEIANFEERCSGFGIPNPDKRDL